MRKALLFVIILFGTTSCQEEVSPSTTLTGKWKWVSTSGGFAAHIFDTPASTGKTIQLELTKGNNFTIYMNGRVTEKGTFQLTDTKCIHDHETKQMMLFSTGTKWMIEKLEENQLYLSDENYDGLSSHFKKNILANLYNNN